jgi:predicted extracellular nuclease
MGDYLGDLTGVVYNAFGFYRVLPLTAISPIRNSTADHPAVTFESEQSCRGITVANYNARNLDPESPYMEGIATQIVEKMLTPDLIFLQEVQDDSGEANDGTVIGTVTLATLAGRIEALSGVVYNYTEVVPENNKDGGAPGGNIRNAYIYRPDVIELWNPNVGAANDKNEVLEGPSLKFNPGRIEPSSSAWEASRKPIAAAWKPAKGTGKPFFTINVHQTSKGGSSSIHGDPRPPINQGVAKRTQQATITAVSCSRLI